MIYKSICIFIFTISLSVIIGHIIDNHTLTMWLSGGIEMTIITAICFMFAAIMCYAILIHYDNSITRFTVITISFILLFIVLILTLILYLEMYLGNKSFITNYLPAIPTVILFLFASIKGMIYSFANKRIGLKIRLISFGSFAISLLGFAQSISEISFIGLYYPTYNVGMSFITCVLSFLTVIVFMEIAKLQE